jgi:hypothetical protein
MIMEDLMIQTRDSLNAFLGRAWSMRVKRRQRYAGTYAVARQLKKQGVGLQVALILLTR